MGDGSIGAFWERYVTRAGPYPRALEDLIALRSTVPALPDLFVRWTTRGAVAAVCAPGLIVGPVGDWLEHALERHRVLCSIADHFENPVLSLHVPFATTSEGFELALDLEDERIVALDPRYYDTGAEAIAYVRSPSLEQLLESLTQESRLICM